MARTKKSSRLTTIRLIASGALVGIAVAGFFGADTSGWMNAIFGAGGATAAAVALKAVHLI